MTKNVNLTKNKVNNAPCAGLETKVKEKKFTVYQLCFMALMAAVTCILAPMSVPIGPIPISLTNLVVYFTVYVIGTKAGIGSYCIYVLLGIVGLPVFSGYVGGPAKIAGPTGGYIVGFILMAAIGGFFIEKFKRNAVLMNAGASLYIGGKADSMKDGIKLAAELIDSGKAAAVLDKFIKVSNR